MARKQPAGVTVGVISDTHGLLRPKAMAALRGADFIIHAGDIGDPEIPKKLAAVAPLTLIRGNVDRDAWARKIPATNVLDAGGVLIYVVHDLRTLDLKPEASSFAAVIYGHSHIAKQQVKNGVLYFNPGSAGPGRFRLPVTVGRLRIRDGKISTEVIELDV
jgi:putative phosphoesterase